VSAPAKLRKDGQRSRRGLRPNIVPQQSADDRMSELLLKWRRSPLLFVTEVLHAEPDQWQRQVLVDVAAHNRMAIRSGHGVGKSSLLSWLILWYITCHFPCKIAVTGANFDQLRATLWAELSLWMGRMPEQLRQLLVYSAESLKIRNYPEQAFAVVRTASKERAQGLAGFHSDHVLVIIDEASAVHTLIFEVLRGALTSEGAKLLMAGNPTQRAGDFFQAFHEQRGLWKTYHISSLDSSRVSRAWIKEQADLYGVDSNVYRVRVLGEFPRQDFDGVIPLDLLEAAAARDVRALDVAPVWGLDVARFGGDRTALAKRQGNVQLEPVKARSGLDTEQVAGWVLNEWLDTPPALRPGRICIDVIGLGAGVFDKLRRERRFVTLGQTVISGVNVAEAAASRDRYERLRDELWFMCREWLQARDCQLCSDDQALIGELAGPKYDERADGRLKVESKDDMVKRGIRSPDLADAWIMTFGTSINSARGTDDMAIWQPEQAVTEYNELWLR
jgi:hypothetical protein